MVTSRWLKLLLEAEIAGKQAFLKGEPEWPQPYQGKGPLNKNRRIAWQRAWNEAKVEQARSAKYE